MTETKHSPGVVFPTYVGVNQASLGRHKGVLSRTWRAMHYDTEWLARVDETFHLKVASDERAWEVSQMCEGRLQMSYFLKRVEKNVTECIPATNPVEIFCSCCSSKSLSFVFPSHLFAASGASQRPLPTVDVTCSQLATYRPGLRA